MESGHIRVLTGNLMYINCFNFLSTRCVFLHPSSVDIYHRSRPSIHIFVLQAEGIFS